jgi:hypothetical protein
LDTNTPQHPVLLSWTAYERAPVHRGRRWYISAGIFVVLFALYSIATRAWTLAVVIVLGGALYFFLHRTPPRTRSVALRDDGFTVNEKFTPWEECSGFWMYRHGTDIELHIEKARGWDKELVTLVTGLDHRDVAQVLGAYLPYHGDRRERILDTIIRICKL